MCHSTLIVLGLLTMPERYPQFPSEAMAQAYYHLACRDVEDLSAQMELTAGWTWEGLRDRRREAEHVRQLYYDVWWCQWNPPHAWPNMRGDLEEAEDRIVARIGQGAFWRGELPLPATR